MSSMEMEAPVMGISSRITLLSIKSLETLEPHLSLKKLSSGERERERESTMPYSDLCFFSASYTLVYSGVEATNQGNLGRLTQLLMALWDLDKQIPLSFHNSLPREVWRGFLHIA